MRRFLALVTSLAIAIVGFIATPAQAVAPANGSYPCTSGSFTVSNAVVTGNTSCAGAVNIPSGVTEIAGVAFQNRAITSVTLPSSLVTIGASAFFGTSLTSLTLPGSVANVGASAFRSLTSLTSLTIQPGSLTYIEHDTFAGNAALAEINFPNTLVAMEYYAFRDAVSLTAITIPESVTYIGSDAFGGATSLMSVTFEGQTAPGANDSFSSVPNGAVAHIRAHATGFGPSGGIWNGLLVERAAEAGMMADGYFSCTGTRLNAEATPGMTVEGGSVTWGADCPGAVTVPNGVTIIGDGAFNYGQATSVSLPSSLRVIGTNAFRFADNLTSITIPNGVTTLGAGAFQQATGLTSITLPASVTTLGVGVFRRASSLESATILGPITSIPNNAFFQAQALRSFVIPASVTSIGDFAFAYTDALESVTMPNGVTSIGEGAFTETALTSMRLPSGLTTLGVEAFSGSSSLTRVNIPIGLTAIPDRAFSGTALNSIEIPNSVTSIGPYAFANTQLKSISIPDTVTSIGESALNGNIHLKSVKIPEGVTTLGNYVFANTDALVSVMLPSTLTTIGDDIFAGAASLSSIYFAGNAPTSVGSQDPLWISNTARVRVQASSTGFSSAWNGIPVTNFAADGLYVCTTGALSASNAAPRYTVLHGAVSGGQNCVGAVTIPDGIPSIGSAAFANAAGVTSISIPATVSDIALDAFYVSPSLTAINVSQSNPVYSSINGVLYDVAQTNLIFYPAGKVASSYAIPAGVTSVGYLAFLLANHLQSITFPSGFLALSSGSFAESGLVSIVIPEGVTDLPEGIFSGATSLNSVTLPTSLTGIGANAFSGAVSLTSINIPSSVDFIGTDAFAGDTNLGTVNFAGNAPRVVGTTPFSGTVTGARAVIQASATGFGSSGSNWNGLTIAIFGSINQNQNQNQNQVVSTPVAKVGPVINFTTRPAVSANGGSFSLNGANLADVKSVKVAGIAAKISLNSSGELNIEIPAGADATPEVVIFHSGGTMILQGFVKVLKPYTEKRTQKIASLSGSTPSKSALAALQKSYLAGAPANVVSCVATVASNASAKGIAAAKKLAKSTCQSMVEFSSFIDTVDVQVRKTGHAGSKAALAVTFDQNLPFR